MPRWPGPACRPGRRPSRCWRRARRTGCPAAPLLDERPSVVEGPRARQEGVVRHPAEVLEVDAGDLVEEGGPGQVLVEGGAFGEGHIARLPRRRGVVVQDAAAERDITGHVDARQGIDRSAAGKHAAIPGEQPTDRKVAAGVRQRSVESQGVVDGGALGDRQGPVQDEGVLTGKAVGGIGARERDGCPGLADRNIIGGGGHGVAGPIPGRVPVVIAGTACPGDGREQGAAFERGYRRSEVATERAPGHPRPEKTETWGAVERSAHGSFSCVEGTNQG